MYFYTTTTISAVTVLFVSLVFCLLFLYYCSCIYLWLKCCCCCCCWWWWWCWRSRSYCDTVAYCSCGMRGSCDKRGHNMDSSSAGHGSRWLQKRQQAVDDALHWQTMVEQSQRLVHSRSVVSRCCKTGGFALWPRFRHLRHPATVYVYRQRIKEMLC